jgi:hypothetical protein
MIHGTMRLAPLLIGLTLTACGQAVCERMDSHMAECGYESEKPTSTTTENTAGFGVCSEVGCNDGDLTAWDTYYTCLDDQEDKCSIDALLACSGEINNISQECWLSLGGLSTSTVTTAK